MSGCKYLTENDQISLEMIRNVSMYVEKQESNVIVLEYYNKLKIWYCNKFISAEVVAYLVHFGFDTIDKHNKTLILFPVHTF